MLMTPTIKRPGDLYILKPSGRIIDGMLGNPTRAKDPKYVGIYDRLRTDNRDISLADDRGVFPRWHEDLKGVWMFVKLEYLFGRGFDHAFFRKSHKRSNR